MKLLNKTMPRAFSALVITCFISLCFATYADEPSEDLMQCAVEASKLANYIKSLQHQILQTCTQGGTIEAIDDKGDSILFYCSKATAL
jgi:hypothetical protein